MYSPIFTFFLQKQGPEIIPADENLCKFALATNGKTNAVDR